MDGDKELSRPELVQKLWKYIKTNDLQDPADRRYILCDDKLKKIFDQDRVNSFGMNKDLSAHLTKKEEPLIKEEQGEIETTPIKEDQEERQKKEEKEVVTTAIGDINSVAKQESTDAKEDGFLLDL
ncbi:SWIB/MDM2 domain-containing protein [Gilbertella persicaria]|uniref:SWIB/MDM2 domain-containing protein n=1 Tax=Gilbertella persicaria TaxID=101096 RepID=UPI002220002D|nr:SWIB/MDM2 domain-containing protein [Gilbertella persicaria]KAI8058689.1 SWIB/MDM2 domain-containing protein [Gilbertella persicaria]